LFAQLTYSVLLGVPSCKLHLLRSFSPLDETCGPFPPLQKNWIARSMVSHSRLF